MSYFPTDIPFMSDDELKENGIHISKNFSDTNVGNIEYISKQAALECVTYDEEYTTEQIKSLPAADVAPVVHGRWIKYTGMGKEQWMCSECSAEEKNPKIARYCYYCGAKMDAQGEE